MEQFDKATFAQVPLRLTGDDRLPVGVRPESQARYRVGSSPAWRLGKKLLGAYLPWRFAAGKPFHAGLPWRGMECRATAIASRTARNTPIPKRPARSVWARNTGQYLL
jgi:sulfide:quinone oxidoreductase